MDKTRDAVRAWIDRARTQLDNGGIQAADLDALAEIVSKTQEAKLRQRLLYLHTTTPNIRSQVIGMALHEPVEGWVSEITTEDQEWPYRTVHDAILDGWYIVNFPDQRALYDDREIDILGYEFILQKLEVYDE